MSETPVNPTPTPSIALMPALPSDQLVGLFNNPNPNTFELAQRMALALASSTMVPKTYRGEENVGNVMIALDMAWRFGMNPLMVMQNLFVVYGNPSWSGSMCIALINSSGLFKNPLAFEYKGKPGGTPDTFDDQWGCRAWAVMKSTGEKVVGPWVDIAMSKAEGWFNRKDKDTGQLVSKWRTIPEMMMTYRAGAYFGRTKCPERLMGLRTVDESEDVGVIDVETTAPTVPSLGETTSEPAETTSQPTGQPAGDTPNLGAPAAGAAPTTGKRTRKKAEPAATTQAPATTSAPPAPPAPPVDPPKPATEPPVTKAEPAPTAPEPPKTPTSPAPAAPTAPAAAATTGEPPAIALARRLQEDGIDVNDFFDWVDASGLANIHHCALDTVEDINGLPESLLTAVLTGEKLYAGLKRTFGKKK